MSSLFLVTSAIKASYDSDSEQRLNETNATLESIWTRLPDADIWVLDGSADDPTELLERLPNRVRLIKFWDSDYRKKVAESGLPMGFLKSAMEVYMVRSALADSVAHYDRVFKISGRYQLTDRFNYLAHNKPSQAVFFRAFHSGLPDAGTKLFLRTCLYSFCPTMQGFWVNLQKQIEDYLWENWKAGKVCDVEHGLHKYLPPESYVQINPIGVMGRIGHLTTGINE